MRGREPYAIRRWVRGWDHMLSDGWCVGEDRTKLYGGCVDGDRMTSYRGCVPYDIIRWVRGWRPYAIRRWVRVRRRLLLVLLPVRPDRTELCVVDCVLSVVCLGCGVVGLRDRGVTV